MDELIERLRECNEPVPVPLELPDDDDISEVEEALLIKLPDELKLFLLSVSDVVCGRLEPVTAADPGSHTYLPEVASRAWDEGLPRHMIPICERPERGGYDCLAHDGRVVAWAYGDETGEEWESLWDWVEEEWLGEGG